jgi:hypothetical protein
VSTLSDAGARPATLAKRKDTLMSKWKIVDLKKNDLVINTRKGWPGKVIEVNTRFGWFTVDYFDGKPKEYRMHDNNTQSVRIMTPEEKADFFLAQEAMGLSDNWREYD